MRLARLAIAALLIAAPAAPARADVDAEVEHLIARELQPIIPADGAGGIAVAVRIGGRTLFFNHGFADRAAKRPITSDSLFNLASLRKLFEVTVLAQAVQQGELKFDDPVARYVTELQQGGAIREVTFGQLASHTSGLLLPTDHPPWPTKLYTFAEFIELLNAWQPEEGYWPGQRHRYTHAGYVLLAVALERRFGQPIERLFQQRVLKPLGMTSTALPVRAPHRRGELAPEFLRRAVQGYSERGEPMGAPGDQRGYYDFPGSGQMFSSTRDLALLLAAHLGEPPADPALRHAMLLTQQGLVHIEPRVMQALAWEVNDYGGPIVVDKPGGLENALTYLGLMPSRKVGIVILGNRGFNDPSSIARQTLLPALARF